MSDRNLDIKILMQTFNEKIASLTSESTLKDAQLRQMIMENDELKQKILQLQEEGSQLILLDDKKEK